MLRARFFFDEKLTLIDENGWGVYLPSILEDLKENYQLLFPHFLLSEDSTPL
jgi:hypothetical protein